MENNKISLNKASSHDIEFLWYLRNCPDIYKYFKQARKISWSKHIEWILPVISGKSNKILYVIKKSKILIGQIRFDYLSPTKAEISISVLKEFRNKGIAKKSIEEAIKLIKKERKLEIISAKIHKENIPSQKLFESLGFKTKNKKNIKWLNYERKIN